MQLYIHCFFIIIFNCKVNYFTKKPTFDSENPCNIKVLNIFNKVFDNIKVEINVKKIPQKNSIVCF